MLLSLASKVLSDQIIISLSNHMPCYLFSCPPFQMGQVSHISLFMLTHPPYMHLFAFVASLTWNDSSLCLNSQLLSIFQVLDQIPVYTKLSIIFLITSLSSEIHSTQYTPVYSAACNFPNARFRV